MRKNLIPGDVIGILGGGQLGRMLALKCAQLGLKAHIYAPEEDSPAFEVSAAHTIAAYGDHEALTKFADAVDIVTYEFENVPADTAQLLASLKPVYPSPRALAVAQDRLEEKNFIRKLGLPLAPYMPVASAAALQMAVKNIGMPSVLKTRRFGYDGKGQVILCNEDEAGKAFDEIGAQPAILESFVPLQKEISIIAARGRTGDIATYDVTENVHRDHILHTSTVPAVITKTIEEQAKQAARTLLHALDYVGVMGVEFFIDQSDKLLVNEIAPRVHNSGHWTLDACVTCQFENHIRAISGWPLGDVTRHSNAVMTNLIGEEVDQWQKALSGKENKLWLYGKREARPGRKMGHVTQLKDKI